jgi:hypothetical protein
MEVMVKMVAVMEKKTLKANLRDAKGVPVGFCVVLTTIVTNQINSGSLHLHV